MSENDQITIWPQSKVLNKKMAPQRSYAITRNDTILYPLANMVYTKSMRRILFNLDGTESLFEEVSRNLLDVSQDELPIRSPRKRPASFFVDSPCDNDDQTEDVENREDHQKSIRQKTIMFQYSPNSALPSPSLSPEMTSATDELWEGNSFEPEANSLCRASRLWSSNLKTAGFVLSPDEINEMEKPFARKQIYRRHHIMRPQLEFDEDKVITGSDDHSVNVYDIKSGKLMRILNGHSGGVWALKYVGNTLVTGSTDRTVRVCRYIFQGHSSTVRCLTIIVPTPSISSTEEHSPQPSQPLIVSGSRDFTLKVWRLPDLDEPVIDTDQKESTYLLHTLSGHTQSVRALAAHGSTVVSGSYDHTVRVWDVEHGKAGHVLTGHTQKVYSVVIDPKRNHCISGSMDSSVRIWNLEDGTCVSILRGHSILVGLLGLSGDCLVSAAADSSLRVWSAETGECQYLLAGHKGAITAFQHDSQKIISGSEGGLKMWCTKTGTLLHELIDDISGVWVVSFDERRCIAAVKSDDVTRLEILDFGVHGLE
ncbi:WD40-repeat-containing domain protein [Phycomyces blakesleeanus]|uniref:WD40-repeat-containing domain protein n=1 Tax=Phycomyces blakesleeanus TaxID=4837 RepID=A0ABR3AKL6_PHYBL